jgi:hypothetical protein
MNAIVSLGRHLVPGENIALVEPFDLNANPQFKPHKEFKSRIVLLNRVTVLAEATPEEFAAAHGFRVLPEDGVAANPAIPFRIETFAPTDNFTPSKPFQTRLLWRDGTGTDQSKLLVTKPEAVIAIVMRGESPEGEAARPAPRRAGRARRRPRAAAPNVAS